MFLFSLTVISVGISAEIPQGSHLLLRMENSLTTRTAKEGDYVYLRSVSPISVDGQIIVPVGSYVQGVVAQTKRSGRVTGRAELAIRLETLTLTQGKVVKFAPI
jgi:type IV secretion system protein VirB10